MERTREHFRRTARSFDGLYAEDAWLSRRLRPALVARRDLAVATVRAYESPRVLDVGCGSGRVGEDVLSAGAEQYVGIDFSEPMLALARQRLERFSDRVTLVEGDFLAADLAPPFDVVLALGLFDYTPKPGPFVRKMAGLCSGSVVASFPRWSWLKGPVRKLRYEVVNDCPIFDYSEPGLSTLFDDAGFSRAGITPIGRSGYLVRADV
jgi:SAM-dependent methyltransferase